MGRFLHAKHALSCKQKRKVPLWKLLRNPHVYLDMSGGHENESVAILAQATTEAQDMRPHKSAQVTEALGQVRQCRAHV